MQNVKIYKLVPGLYEYYQIAPDNANFIQNRPQAYVSVQCGSMAKDAARMILKAVTFNTPNNAYIEDNWTQR